MYECTYEKCVMYVHYVIVLYKRIISLIFDFFLGGGAFDVILIKSLAMIFVSLCRMVFAILGVHLL